MITSHDIARICGVSRGTVDRVLNNRPNVNPKTKEAVLKAVEELGYRPNYIASSLSKKRTDTVGIVVLDLKNRFFSQFVDSTELRLREHGYFSYLMVTHKDAKDEIACIRNLRDRRADGIIIMPIGLENTLKELEGTATITFGNKLFGLPHVGIDEYEAGAKAAEYIKSKGYTRAVYISPPLMEERSVNIWAQQERYAGFVSVMDAALITNPDFEADLDRVEKKTAVVGAMDVYALRAHRYFRQKGFMPGKDIGIMGFDNIDTLDYVEPRIDTMALRIEEAGRAAADHIAALIENKAYDPPVLRGEIVEGQTL